MNRREQAEWFKSERPPGWEKQVERLIREDRDECCSCVAHGHGRWDRKDIVRLLVLMLVFVAAGYVFGYFNEGGFS